MQVSENVKNEHSTMACAKNNTSPNKKTIKYYQRNNCATATQMASAIISNG